ncbi:respiratory nitrate reductase subunit gamma [Nocardia pseudobrasiliensis]|uniref:Respiratory nitrate reductase gamma subunit n=1 Tax=Nocardia pseudobrasiliensis TaxID=45979 RepID=A0A370IEF9_9NOCA|nr:respiratory nitrate reductase subunit gamma [Nocardia pseudobrasiliensis]RDI68511.1 respiratory nitrate reductase gamma subunit [Nocardia pseudobrasiliensis]
MMFLMWIILPYSAFASFALGHLWRYRHDRFGPLEPGPDAGRLERIGPAIFRIGIAGVLGARVLDMIGSTSHTTDSVHTVATVVEILAQPFAILGAMLLIVPPLIAAMPNSAVSPLDRFTLPVLAATVLSRVAIDFGSNPTDGEHPAAEMLFVWFRSLFSLHPNPEALADAPVMVQARGLILLVLIALWPYTRLGGTFAGPIVRLTHRFAAKHRLPQHFPVGV